MPSSVKMYAIVDGVETEIGRCHPGQARLLRKKGLGEWRDGKIWLMEAPKPVTIDLKGGSPEAVVEAVKIGLNSARVPMSDWMSIPMPDWRRPPAELTPEMLEEAGVEGGDWQDIVKERHGPTDEIKDVVFHEFRLLLREYVRRMAMGHECYAHDEHWSRHMGFVDSTVKEYLCIRLNAAVRERIEEAAAKVVGITLPELWELIATPEGRRKLFGTAPLMSEGTPVPDEEIEWGVPMVDSTADEVVAVGMAHMFEPVLPEPLSPEETVAERASRIPLQNPEVSHPVAGWTHFAWPDAYEAIPVRAHMDEHGSTAPYPVIPPDATLAEYRFPRPSRTGVYQRVKERLYRVWSDGSGWDVSVLQKDGTYLLESEHQSVDPLYMLGDDKAKDFVKVGFRGQLEACEEMIHNPDPLTRHKQGK